jgi:hypothetical protein
MPVFAGPRQERTAAFRTVFATYAYTAGIVTRAQFSAPAPVTGRVSAVI